MLRPATGGLLFGLVLGAGLAPTFRAVSGAPGAPVAFAAAAPRTDAKHDGKPDPKLRSVEAASAALAEARNEKVRVQAALVLGRLGQVSAIPVLVRALADRSAIVRGVAAQVLGDLARRDEVRSQSARSALEVASRDDNPMVRRRAAMALHKLDRAAARVVIEVNPMGDHTRRAPAALREGMRGAVTAALAPMEGEDRVPGVFSVDGSIRVLELSQRPTDVEVKCGVELVLSTRPGNSIVLMATGEATVQRPRAHYRSAMLAEMQSDALKHAVRGAAEELRQHLASHRVPGARALETPAPPGTRGASPESSHPQLDDGR